MADVEPDHLAVLMFTSGTAGAARAAMLTHRNLLSNLEQARSTSNRISEDDVVYGVIPLYHIFGLNVVLALTLSVGATIVLVQRFDPATALESIRARERHRRAGVAGGVGGVRPLRRGARRRAGRRRARPVGRGEAAGVGRPSASWSASASPSPRATASPRRRRS